MGDASEIVESRDWKAWQDPKSIHVAGTVVVIATNYVARLGKHSPQGFNPRILVLDLHVERVGEVGGDAITPIRVQYSQVQGTSDGYDAVTILGGKGGAQIDRIDPVV